MPVGIPYVVEAHRAPTMQCILQSAINRNVPADVLLAIGEHEKGWEGAAIKNKDGSRDLGRAGINTTHLQKLRTYGVSEETATYYLKNDGCYNYDMAAYLLRDHLDKCTKEYWTCVANYHSKTPSKNEKYRAAIIPLANKWKQYLMKNYPLKDYSK